MKGFRAVRPASMLFLWPLMYAVILALSYVVMEARLGEAFLYQGF